MDFEFNQLTLLSLFALIISLRYLVSVSRGVRPVLILSKQKIPAERFIESLPVAAVGLTAALILRKIFTPHIGAFLAAGFNMPTAIQQIGFLIALLSFALLIAGYWSLGNNWRVGTGEEAQKELVQTGIYSFTRNPVYLFFNLYLFGFFLLNGDYLILVLNAIVVLSLHRVILEEEKLLHERFGGIYQNYTESTPRYFFTFNILN